MEHQISSVSIAELVRRIQELTLRISDLVHRIVELDELAEESNKCGTDDYTECQQLSRDIRSLREHLWKDRWLSAEHDKEFRKFADGLCVVAAPLREPNFAPRKLGACAPENTERWKVAFAIARAKIAKRLSNGLSVSS